MKILILGHEGMLGSMLVSFFKNHHDVWITDQRFPSEEFNKDLLSFDGDFIINAIGSIPQKNNSFDVNIDLPIWLDKNLKIKIIHPGSDCEDDETEYGKSKKYASDFIKTEGVNTKILKCSIIGPEIKAHKSLFDWFLSSKDSVYGYTKVTWNGITTLEWAKQCYILMVKWNEYEKETIIEGTCISKFILLNLIKEVFNKKIEIIPDMSIVKDKCLIGHIRTIPIFDQLKELKEHLYNEDAYTITSFG